MHVFHDPVAPHSHDIFPGQRHIQIDALHIVKVVGVRRVGNGFTVLKLVASIKPAIRRTDLQIEVVHKSRE